MAISPRTRRIALAAAAVTLAAGVPSVAIMSANAAGQEITKVEPPAAINTATQTAVEVKFTTEPPGWIPVGEPGVGLQADLIAPNGEVLKGNVKEPSAPSSSASTVITAVFNFAAAPLGLYDAKIYTGSDETADECIDCFEVVAVSNPTITGVNPTRLPVGREGESFTVRGTNFNRGTEVLVTLPGQSTQDPSITLSDATDEDDEVIQPTTTQIEKRIRIAANAPVGARDVVVTNLGSAPVRLSSGFFVTGIVIDSIAPSAGANTTSRQVAFTGRNFPTGARAQLVRGDQVIEGTNVVRTSTTQLTATFDLTGRPIGQYTARVLTSDGLVSSADECSPQFTVISGGSSSASASSTATATATATSTASSSSSPYPAFTCQNASSASASPTATRSGTASPTTSPSGSNTASPTTSPSPGNDAATVTINVNVQRITSGNAPTISGTVTDSSGQPVRNRDVQLLAREYNSSTYRAFPTDEPLRTDNNGNYSGVVRPIRQTAFVTKVDDAQSPSLVVFVFTRVNLDRSAANTVQPRSYQFRGDLDPNAPDLRGAAVGLAIVGRDARGRATFSVINQTVTRNDAAATYTLGGRNGVLPVGTNTYVVFTSARNGLGKGSASVRFTVR